MRVSAPATEPQGRATSARPGQALVEFALIVTLLALIGFATVEVGRAVHAYISVTHAARDGARVAMNH